MKLKVSVNNAGKIMQVVNTFFKKPAAQLFENQSRFERVDLGDGNIEYKEVIFDQYEPQIGKRCEWHPMFKEEKPIFKNPPILGIFSPYETDGISLEEGDTVEYKGSRLIVRNLNLKSRRRSHPKTFVFVHETFTEEELNKHWNDLLYAYVVDVTQAKDIYDLFSADTTKKENDNEVDSRVIRSFAFHLKDSVFAVLADLKEMTSNVEVWSDEGYRLIFNCDLEHFKNHGWKGEMKKNFNFTIVDEAGNELLVTSSLNEVSKFLCSKLYVEEQEETAE